MPLLFPTALAFLHHLTYPALLGRVQWGPLDRALGLEIPGRVQWEPLEVQAQGPVQVPLDTPLQHDNRIARHLQELPLERGTGYSNNHAGMQWASSCVAIRKLKLESFMTFIGES
jgi:hypothetical protein